MTCYIPSVSDLESTPLTELLPGIRARASEFDQTGAWPEQDLEVLAHAGAMRWAIPAAFGGKDLSAIELHFRYEAVAAASLATALVLTQRDSAVGIITASQNEDARADLLPRLARNEIFATVGIAQLTTSRQHGEPALVASEIAGGYRINGVIPWSSGADRSAYVIAGAAVGPKQILFALPTNAEGVTVESPLPLVALAASHTGAIRCDDVLIEPQHLLAGPAENVLAGRKKSLPIGQSFLAMGLARGALDLIAEHDSQLARSTQERFESQLRTLRAEVLNFCDPSQPPRPEDGPRLRGACNEQALRTAHSAVALYKGTGLLASHPAQRLAREALFLLVWSCPNPVIDCTVNLLSAGPSFTTLSSRDTASPSS
jgi:alkylation response protein AidB-like acyl-CoA dehydrogenase